MSDAQRIYFAIYKQKIPSQLEIRYRIASEKLCHQYSNTEIKQYKRIVNSSIRDFESIEYAARILKKVPLLSDHFRLMVFLAETVPQNRHFYINTREQLTVAYLYCLGAVLKSAIKFVKGFLLLTWVEHA